jgi:hypothetical protein
MGGVYITMIQIRKIILKAISSMLVVALVVQTFSISTSAWEQDAHMVINRRAIQSFEGSASQTTKYRNAPVNFKKLVDAPHVISSSKFASSYQQIWAYDTIQSHIIHGGYSSDEPHAYVSVKHFYDPLKLSGYHELTDQYSLHGWHVYEAIPATDWALYRMDNPYSLANAIFNYKSALEISADSPLANIHAASDFRDFAGTPTDLKQMREMYTGKAMRGLGEVMHLMADMTQPAHVRNDSHPKYEVTEQAITGPVASALTRFPRLDGLNINELGKSALDLMKGISTWTNANFYSADTIADTKLGITPYNWEKPYSSPQLSNMTQKEHLGSPTWFQKIGGKEIPMVKSYPGFWSVAGRYNLSYEITPEFAIAQGEVLIPLAVAATAKTIDLFFPTLELTQTVTGTTPDDKILEEALEKGAEELKQFSFGATVTHHRQKDPQWDELGFTINYAGPGEIWRLRGRRSLTKVCDVEFRDGKIYKYQDPETGEMVDGTPIFWMPLGSSKRIRLGGNAIDYVVEMEDVLFTAVTAGAQELKSPHYLFETNAPTLTLEADRTTIMPGEKVEFSVEVKDAPERYRLEWTFGDEEDDEEDIKAPVTNRKKIMTHTYQKEKEYLATVRLIDIKRNIVRAQDSINISSYMGEMAGPWDVVMEITEENQFFRALIIAIMKGIVNFIIVPLIRAFGEDPGEDISSALDSFTFIGTTMTYSLDLRKKDGDDTVYEGPFEFIESNTGYIEGADGVVALRLEIRKGTIVMTALGYTDEGAYVEYEFLKNGKMTSPGVMEGDFNLPGFMSGTWVATKR